MFDIWGDHCGSDDVLMCYSIIKDEHHLLLLSNEILISNIVLITLRNEQNGRYFADNIYMCIFFDENYSISIEFSPRFVPKGLVDKYSSLINP